MTNEIFQIITVTLNPAIDRTVNIRNFTKGALNQVEYLRSNAAGKGINVASALADYGYSVAVTGFLGRENSAIFEDLLDQKDIADHFVRIAGHTRVGITINDPVTREITEINFPGCEPSAEDVAALRHQLDELSAL